MNRSHPVRRFERAVKNRQVLRFQSGSSLDGSSVVHVFDYGLHLRIVVSEFSQSRRDGIVDDLDRAAADQLLVLHQSQIGLDAGRIAIHHEADGSGWS